MLMVAIKPFNSPLDYSLCDQKVTIYRLDGEEVDRIEVDRAFLEFRKVESVNKTGSVDSGSFLLVIPGSEADVRVGDKVMLGEGPEVATAKEWRGFIPAKVPGLVVVSYVDQKYFHGKMVHVEAGG